jgi:hypothetical protein
MAAVTGTGALAVGGILTLGAPSGGVYEVGMTFTNAGITQPQAPAVKITSQLTGTTGLAGTYQTNLSQLITSSTFTFSLWQTASNAPNNGLIPYALSGSIPLPPLPSIHGLIPPPPLPGAAASNTTTTSYST